MSSDETNRRTYNCVSKQDRDTKWYLVNLRVGVERLSWTDYVGYHDELHNYGVTIQGIRHSANNACEEKLQGWWASSVFCIGLFGRRHCGS